MATGASSLGVVREELFATMTETQQNLERFLEERDSGTLLQRSVHNLQQVKGILSLIGLTGAEMLAQEMQTLATASPEALGVVTNTAGTAASEMPGWLKAMKPKGAYAGISLVVIQ